MIIHLTIRATHLPVLLTYHEVAAWLWPRMRRVFPDGLAAILMPTHPHLVIPTANPDESRRRFMGLFKGMRRSDNPGAAIRWETPGAPDVLGDPRLRIWKVGS